MAPAAHGPVAAVRVPRLQRQRPAAVQVHCLQRQIPRPLMAPLGYAHENRTTAA